MSTTATVCTRKEFFWFLFTIRFFSPQTEATYWNGISTGLVFLVGQEADGGERGREGAGELGGPSAVGAPVVDPVLRALLQQPPVVDGALGAQPQPLLEGRVGGGACEVALVPEVLLDVLEGGAAGLLQPFDGSP